MKKNLFVVFILFVSMCFVYMVHLEFTFSKKEFLIKSYIINILIAIVSLILLGIGIHKKKYNLTSIYLLTVVIKLFVYFIYFDPKFRSDKIVTREEFFMFFVPYLLVSLFRNISFIKKIFISLNKFKKCN